MDAHPYCESDHTFGPTVTGCRGDFDFTVKFEDIVLCLLPALVFIVFGALMLRHVCHATLLIKELSCLLVVKLVRPLTSSALDICN